VPGAGPIRLGRPSAERERAERERGERGPDHDQDVERQLPADGAGPRDAGEGVIGVGERQERRRGLQIAGHVVPIHEEAAQQELREDDGGHELHRLELRPRERADEQPEGHAQQTRNMTMNGSSPHSGAPSAWNASGRPSNT
jgi:hypothetical protein